jgi:sugar O-acyltransferase (sialic acid O-acetyltransferase NeuD family)
MSGKLLILGAGGNSLGVVDAIEAAAAQGEAAWTIVGFLDDLPENRNRRVLGYPVLGTVDDAPKFADCLLVNGISSVASFRKREAITARSGAAPERFATVIHPAAVVSARAKIGRGCVILANSVICMEAVLEDHVLILQGSTVNQPCAGWQPRHLVGGRYRARYVDIAPRAHLISGGASVAPYVKIGAGALVGLGSVVIRDVEGGSVVAGNPARPLRRVVTGGRRLGRKRGAAAAGGGRVRVLDDELRALQALAVIDFRAREVLVAHRVDQQLHAVLLHHRVVLVLHLVEGEAVLKARSSRRR